MVRTKVNIAVADDHLDRFADVVSEAREAGLLVEHEMAELGVVSGSIDAEKLPDLDRVPGVAAVEEERIFQLPPPESSVQ